jgi:hypothetical protein
MTAGLPMASARARPGFIMLAHTALDRAGQVARFWAEAGAPVAIHVDARVPAAEHARLVAALAGLPGVHFVRRRRCEWGTWSIVAAMQEAAALLLARSDATHVYAASGACLPLRPVGDLARFLDRYPGTDFIESVSLEDVNWTKGGLSHERLTLYHPIGFKQSKWLFDRLVDLQRRLGVRRALPAGLDPHLGSQWWCLTRETLERILSDPERRARERFFRTTWIPDESWFQTLARLHARRIESRSLTLSKFDHQGKPHLFYDDHLQLLKRSDCFVARKIWPGANRLYEYFLAPRPPSDAEPQPARIDRHFARATEQRLRGRPGLYMVGRFPMGGRGGPRTAAPYSVFQGLAELYPEFDLWLSQLGGCRVHGHLYAPERAEFAGGEKVFAGGLSDAAALRDYNPVAFLTNLIWATRGERQVFQIGPGDRLGRDLEVLRFIAGDRHAQVSVVSGAWAVPLSRRAGPADAIRREAARLQQIELAMLEILRAPEVQAEVRIWTLAEFLENPAAALQPVLAALLPGRPVRPQALPAPADLSRFGSFLQRLRNQGMAPVVMGDFPLAPEAPDPSHRMK